MPDRLLALLFAARGWILAALFLALVASRAVSEAPLRFELLGVVAAGMLLRAWAGRHLGPHGNGSRAEAPAIATTGPYAFSRHPLYLANIAVSAGLVLFANSLPAWAALAFIAAIFAHHLALALWEEKNLRALKPEAYAAYADSVPRWFRVKPPEETAPASSTGPRAPEDRESAGALEENHPLEPTSQRRNLFYALACVAILWAAAWL